MINYKDFGRFHKYVNSTQGLKRMVIFKNNNEHHYVLTCQELSQINSDKLVWYELQ